MAVAAPLELRGAAVSLVVALQVALALLVRAALVAQAAFPAGAVRRVIVVERIAALIVGLAQVVLAPVRFFHRRIDSLGDALQPAAVSGRRDQRVVLGDAS